MKYSTLKHAFSLVEMVVIVAVTACVIALVLPLYSAKKDRDMGNKCMDNLKKLGVGMKLYGADWGGKFPIATEGATGGKPRLFIALSPYIDGDVNLFQCPADSGDLLLGGSSTPYWVLVFKSSYAWPDGYPGSVTGLPQDNPVPPGGATLWVHKLPLSKRPALWDHRPWHRATNQASYSWSQDTLGVSGVLYCDGHAGSERHSWLIAGLIGSAEPK